MPDLTYAQVKALITSALVSRPTGTKVRVTNHQIAEIAILDYIKAFIDSSNQKMNSPFCGNIYPEMQSAIKYMAVRELQPDTHFWIESFAAGVVDGNSLTYYIRIKQSTDLNQSTGVEALQFEVTVAEPLTGIQCHALQEWNGSGRLGEIVIDWSKLEQGNLYQFDGYVEGALFAHVTYSTSGALARQIFSCTPGQTQLTVTLFTLTSNCLIVRRGAFQSPSSYTIAGQVVTLLTAADDGEEIVIYD